MSKYKVLNLEGWEIDEFNDFIKKMATDGWHPVKSWTRFLSLLKFEYDPLKTGEYAVVYNQQKVGANFSEIDESSNLNSDSYFKSHLDELEIDVITPYSYFDILYLSDKSFPDEFKVNDTIKKRVGKKRFSSNLWLSIAWIFILILNINIYGNSPIEIFSSIALQTFVLYGYILLSTTVLAFKYYLFYKGKTFKRGSKWRDINNLNWHALRCVSIKGALLLMVVINVGMYSFGGELTVHIITISIVTLLLAFLWNFIDKKIAQFKLRIVLKVISFIVVLWLYIALSMNVLLSNIADSRDSKIQNTELINLYCKDQGTDYTSHSFFIQLTTISCFDGNDYAELKVYDIKSKVFKDSFKNSVLKDLDINNYEANTVFKHTVKYYGHEYLKNVYINDRYILVSDIDINNEVIDYFS